MLYSDVLLEACKTAGVVDQEVESLTRLEKRQYAGYLRNAVARFNNNPSVSIGTEKLMVRRWMTDDLGHFARIVRNSDDDLDLFDDGTQGGVNVSKIKWNGIDGRSMQELPQRLISATARVGVPNPLQYRIVSEKNFFESNHSERVICYSVQENDAIARVRIPEMMLLLFDRAILYPWETRPGESVALDGYGNPLPAKGDLLPGERDPLDVQIMLPISHVPYLVNLAAYELAMGIKAERSLTDQIRNQITGQENDMLRNNVRDRVKLSYTHRDMAFNFWTSRTGG
jgi:hypothetical protein